MQIKSIATNKTFVVVLSLVLAGMISGTLAMSAVADATQVQAWWPTNGVHVTGTQPFKAVVQGLDPSQYDMFWQVDGGTWNWMDNNNTDSPHKEASVDVSGWNWHGAGPYTVNFIARQNGAVIAQQSEQIYIDNGQPIVLPSKPVQQVTVPSNTVAQVQVPIIKLSPAVAPVVTPTAQPVSITQGAAVFASALVQNNTQAVQNTGKLYVDPNSDAAKNAGGDSNLQMLASQPTATWFGNWNSNIYNDVHNTVTSAAAAGATPVLVAYNIPERDCGGFSSGGSDNPSGYQSWIGSFASAIGNNKAIVILEPDALAQISCLSSADQATRLSLLSGAVSTLKANGNTKVYIDAGHSNWVDASTMAGDLQKANVSQADGFSLNVSNFMSTGDETAYGQQISSQVGGKHFVVDTSRNGKGSNGQWCNPGGMAIGQKPTTNTGNSLVDAFLWVKTPGESDGNCNGGPSAGQWWGSYADQLVQNAH
ncbi:MAG TPA: glycoside hydrolase family 6 protein [Candidatus Paceibacterota bacterium]|nr:glycoside hydrolase family 6 protein [Candidatus Paceibacterota bacterium]